MLCVTISTCTSCLSKSIKVCDVYRVGGGELRLSVIMTLSVQK